MALAWTAWAGARGREREGEEVLARALAAGLETREARELTRAVRREADPVEARLAAARALLHAEIVRPAASGAGRLPTARDLAREALARQPASWEASWILGAAIALERSRARDPRLFSLARDWEAPLARAIEIAPAALEPQRLLAGAYVDVWPVLSPAKRELAERLLVEALADRTTFQRLIGPWIEIAGSFADAARLVPDQPWAWRAFVDAAGRRRDWSDWITYEERRRSAELAAFDAALAAAEKLQARGELGRARTELDAALAALLPDAAHAGRLERLLAHRPAGPAAERAGEAAVAWIEWSLPLALLGRNPLSADALARLASLAGSRIPADRAALVALATGDLPRAELYERRSDALWSERWAPYLTLKARLEQDRGATTAARTLLESAHRDYRPRLPWRLLAPGLGLAPEPRGAQSWEATDWLWERGLARLELLPAHAAPGLAIHLATATADGGLLELHWDGAALPPLPVPPGTRELEARFPVTPEPHLLELRPRAGRIAPAPKIELLK